MSESARGVRNKIFSLGLLLFVLPIISFGQSNSDTSRLGSEDRQSIESACSYEKLALGPAVYHQCVQKQLNAVGGSRSPDLSNLTQEDRQSIESACSYEKLALGPAVYHQWVQKQLVGFQTDNRGTHSTATDQSLTSPIGGGSTANSSTVPTASSPTCAENGSCYGDLNANGVPKTVHVNGYYRKDGTYVRGYYRSAPG